MGAIDFIIHSDSQLAAQQLVGAYETKNDRLYRYTQAYVKLKIEFREVVLQKVPREENRKVDELAWMTSTLSS